MSRNPPSIRPGARGQLGVEAVLRAPPSPRRIGWPGRRCRARPAGRRGGRRRGRSGRGGRRSGRAGCARTRPPPAASAMASEPDRDQQVGVGGAGRLRRLRAGERPRQPGVAGLPDLDPAVVDELRGDEAGRRRRRSRAQIDAFGSQRRTGRGRDPDRPVTRPQQPPFQEARSRAGGARPTGRRRRPTQRDQRFAIAARRRARRSIRRPDPDHEAVDVAVEPPRRLPRSTPDEGRQRAQATLRRCYHRASLRLLFR